LVVVTTTPDSVVMVVVCGPSLTSAAFFFSFADGFRFVSLVDIFGFRTGLGILRMRAFFQSAFSFSQEKDPVIERHNLTWENVYLRVWPKQTAREWSLSFDFFEHTRALQFADKQRILSFHEWLMLHEFVLQPNPLRPKSSSTMPLALPVTAIPDKSPYEVVIARFSDFFKQPVPSEFQVQINAATAKDIQTILVKLCYVMIPDYQANAHDTVRATTYAGRVSDEFILTVAEYHRTVAEWDKYNRYTKQVDDDDNLTARENRTSFHRFNFLQEICFHWIRTQNHPQPFRHMHSFFQIDEIYTAIVPRDRLDYVPVSDFVIEQIYSFGHQHTLAEWKNLLGDDLIHISAVPSVIKFDQVIPDSAPPETKLYRLCDILKFCTPLAPPVVPFTPLLDEASVPVPEDPQRLLDDIRTELTQKASKRVANRSAWLFAPATDAVHPTTGVFDATRIQNLIAEVNPGAVLDVKLALAERWRINQEAIAGLAHIKRVNQSNVHVEFALRKLSLIRRFKHWATSTK
jgi:hypothetical protein